MPEKIQDGLAPKSPRLNGEILRRKKSDRPPEISCVKDMQFMAKRMVGDTLIVRKSSLRLKKVVIYRKMIITHVFRKSSLQEMENQTEKIFEVK